LEDAVSENVITLLCTGAWKTKATYSKLWRQNIEQAKIQFGL